MQKLHTHYDTLKVSKEAPPEVIRAAFKSLSQKYHPDRNSHPDAIRIMQSINDAYATLSNPIKRAEYDKWLFEIYNQVDNTAQSYSRLEPNLTQNKIIEIHIPSSLSLASVSQGFASLLFKLKKIIKLLMKVIIILLFLSGLLLLGEVVFEKLKSYFPTEVTDDYSEDITQDVSGIEQEPMGALEDITTVNNDGSANIQHAFLDTYPEPVEPSSDIQYVDNTFYPETSYPVIEDSMYAPNGQLYPISADYIDGYPKLNNDGHSILTIDNSKNHSPIFGKLYYLDSINPYPVRHVYIPPGEGLNVRNLSPGNYDLRYKDLSSGQIFKTEAFEAQEFENNYETSFSEIEMTIYKVANGNMHTYEISESEF